MLLFCFNLASLSEQLVSSYCCVAFTFQDIGKVSLVHMLQPSHINWSVIILFLLRWCLSHCSWRLIKFFIVLNVWLATLTLESPVKL